MYLSEGSAMDKAALWIGYAVMVSSGVILAALCAWAAAEAGWRAWRAWRGFFNIVEAFDALREKQATDGVPATPAVAYNEAPRELRDSYQRFVRRVPPGLSRAESEWRHFLAGNAAGVPVRGHQVIPPAGTPG
jgi:hypothetical protein